jgi:hypothetical protein
MGIIGRRHTVLKVRQWALLRPYAMTVRGLGAGFVLCTKKKVPVRLLARRVRQLAMPAAVVLVLLVVLIQNRAAASATMRSILLLQIAICASGLLRGRNYVT